MENGELCGMCINLKPTLFADNWDTTAHIALVAFQCKPNVVGLSVCDSVV